MLLLLGILIKILVVVGVTEGAVAYLIWVERKVAAYSQDRIGPNRCGMEFGIPFGLVQPLVDGAKMLLKEDVVPRYVNKPIFILAPAIAIIAATIGFAVVPFGSVGPGSPINFQIAPNVDIGIVYVFAVGSLAVYGVILGGWASNNKYSFLGGLRSSASSSATKFRSGCRSSAWSCWPARSTSTRLFIGRIGTTFGAFSSSRSDFSCSSSARFAETNRLPFDLPESEQELVGGYHTEYSAMKFGMFFLGEYLHVITVSYLTVVLFFGGWDVPFLLSSAQDGWFWSLVKVAVMAGKVALMIFFVMWVRWTLPRFRYDQLMDLAWKKLIPLALVNLVLTAVIVQLIRG